MTVGSLPLLGILFALASAAVMSLGNLWQAKGVGIAATGNARSSAMRLLKTPIWLAGTALFGVAVLLQMASLAFAPLIVVQPIGIAALVFAALLTAREKRRWPSKAVVRAIAISLIGVTAYVIIAATYSEQKPIDDQQLIAILLALAGVMVLGLIGRFAARGLSRIPIVYVMLGGIFSGFVAALGKTVILRIESMLKAGTVAFDGESLLTLLCIVGIGVSSAISIYFVQLSHTCNSPDVVIAGLTVVDPAVAVILGITILQEAAGAPLWVAFAFLAAGLVAFTGVIKLARAEDAADAASDTTSGDAPAAPPPSKGS